MNANEVLEKWFTPYRFAILAACVIAACFLPVIFGQQTFFFRDYSIFSYPLAAYHREAFWRGDIPLWNPYNNCGIPFLAQWNTMVLYPLSLIYLLFPMPWSLSFFCLCHLFLGGLGMYSLAKHWTGSGLSGAVAGMAFMFNGVLLSCLKWPNNIAALGWMPWVVLMTDRALLGGYRSIGIAALVGATQMLAGAPEVILLTWAFLGCWTVYRMLSARPQWLRIVAHFTIVIVLVGGLSAVQLAPFLDLLRHSQRDASFAGSEWPMPIWGWSNFLLPLFKMFRSHHGVYAQPGQYWISTYYVSIIVLFLAILALCYVRRRGAWLLGGLVLFVSWMALGEEALLYKWARIIPGVSMLRFPIKFVVLAAFALPLLGAWGIHHLTTRPQDSKLPRSFLISTGMLLLGVVGLYLLALSGDNKPAPILGWNALGRAVFLLAGVGCIVGLMRGAPRPHLAAALLAIIVIDGLTHAPWQNPTTPSWVYSGEGAEMQEKPTLGQNRAFISAEAAFKMDRLLLDAPSDDVMASRLALFSNINLIDRIPKLDGFFALYPKQAWDIQRFLYHTTNQPPEAILDFLGVSQMTVSGSWSKWQTRTNPLPLITSPEKIRFADRPLDEIAKPDFDPRKEAVASVGADLSPGPFARGEIRDIDWKGDRVSFSTTASGPSVIVLAQTFYPWWKAYLDGQQIEVERVNHAFQALQIPAGTHNVLLRYEDRSYKIGGIVSVIFSLLVTLAVVFGRTKI